MTDKDKKRTLAKPLVERARVFRRDPTRSEALLWDKLRRRGLDGLKFRRQHRIGNFIVDFYLRCQFNPG